MGYAKKDDVAMTEQEAVTLKGVQGDATVKNWMNDYPLPSEDARVAATARPNISHRYKPPTSDFVGVTVACTVIVTWATLFHHAMWHVDLRPEALTTVGSWVHVLAVFFALEFMFTGLFITTHDAMHGTIAYRNKPLNDALGFIAISFYAMFDYGVLKRKHWEHHNHCGVPHQDPDFHRGNTNVVVWFFRFMFEYMTIMQFVKLGTYANVCMYFGAPYHNVLVYMTGSAVLAAVRLFYYGTYLPHRPPSGRADEVMDWTKSASSAVSLPISFLTCWCFDYHWEHHRWPYAPWYHLAYCKELAAQKEA